MKKRSDSRSDNGAGGPATGVTPLNFVAKAKDFVSRNGGGWSAPERRSQAWEDWMAYFNWLDDQVRPPAKWAWTVHEVGMTVPAATPADFDAEAFEPRMPTSVDRSKYPKAPDRPRPVSAAKVLDNGYVVSPEERGRVIDGFAKLGASIGRAALAEPDVRRASTPEGRERAETFHAQKLERIAADIRANPEGLKLSAAALATLSRDPGSLAPPPPESAQSERDRLLHGPGDRLQGYWDEKEAEPDHWRSLGEALRR